MKYRNINWHKNETKNGSEYYKYGFLPSVLNVGHVFAMNFSWKRRNVGGGGINSNFSLEFETILNMTI